jgi:S-adenosylmethionine hydrolase
MALRSSSRRSRPWGALAGARSLTDSTKVPQSILALLTDFGSSDGYLGAMKGVLLSGAPDAQIVDIAHDIPAGDVLAGAWTLATAWDTFPPETVFLCVVDPGVGSARRGLALAISDKRFVCPDNGLLTLVLAHAPSFEAVSLTKRERWRPSPSSVFHGRDVFAPVAAALATGSSLDEVGERVEAVERLQLATPTVDANGRVRGHVIHLDRFGNVISDIPTRLLPRARFVVRIAQRTVREVHDHYAAAPRGRLFALVNSAGHLEIALRDGSAAGELQIGRGAPLEIDPAGLEPTASPG